MAAPSTCGPQANDDSATTNENTPVTIAVLAERPGRPQPAADDHLGHAAGQRLRDGELRRHGHLHAQQQLQHVRPRSRHLHVHGPERQRGLGDRKRQRPGHTVLSAHSGRALLRLARSADGGLLDIQHEEHRGVDRLNRSDRAQLLARVGRARRPAGASGADAEGRLVEASLARPLPVERHELLAQLRFREVPGTPGSAHRPLRERRRAGDLRRRREHVEGSRALHHLRRLQRHRGFRGAEPDRRAQGLGRLERRRPAHRKGRRDETGLGQPRRGDPGPVRRLPASDRPDPLPARRHVPGPRGRLPGHRLGR